MITLFSVLVIGSVSVLTWFWSLVQSCLGLGFGLGSDSVLTWSWISMNNITSNVTQCSAFNKLKKENLTVCQMFIILLLGMLYII